MHGLVAPVIGRNMWQSLPGRHEIYTYECLIPIYFSNGWIWAIPTCERKSPNWFNCFPHHWEFSLVRQCNIWLLLIFSSYSCFFFHISQINWPLTVVNGGSELHAAMKLCVIRTGVMFFLLGIFFLNYGVVGRRSFRVLEPLEHWHFSNTLKQFNCGISQIRINFLQEKWTKCACVFF